MVGMMQIMIWMLCVYLVFKGVEIFQIAWMSPREGSRTYGVILGLIMVGIAIVAAASFFVTEEAMAKQISDSQRSIPGLNR